MASSMPIPLPPRTPTPPPEDDHEVTGLGLQDAEFLSPTKASFDANAWSPLSEHFPSRFGSLSSPMLTPAGALIPGCEDVIHAPTLQESWLGITEDFKNPFNFQTVSYSNAAPASKSVVGKRRGHRYKHSSVSHQIILEPAPKSPLQLPASFPMPSYREFRTSMSREQALRALWCLCHLLVAAFIQWTAQGSMAMTSLSHLTFIDFLGAVSCAAVNVLGNFDVWKRSSIRHPFGLQRLEVLAGFGLSVTLTFLGFDIISHGLKHILEDVGSHKAHHGHHHDRVSREAVQLASVLSIVATLVSAFGLRNHERIGKAMQLTHVKSLRGELTNPAHLLTLSCSMLLLSLPLVPIHMYNWVDRGIAALMATAMFALGARLMKTLGNMLLMSYNGPGALEVLRDIQADSVVCEIEEAKFWQVHYDLCMANLKLRVRGTDESLGRLRDRISSLVSNRLGGAYGAGRQKWEVSTQLTLETE